MDAPAPLTAPTAPGERQAGLDALRGLALLGVLLVNTLAFSGPLQELGPLAWWTRPADRAVEAALLLAAEGAFYTLFSLLFGYGFGLQLVRAEARGEAAVPRYRRRLGWLLAIGAAHLLLVWRGDILVAYALVGLLLPALRALPPGRLLRRSVALLGLSALLWAGLGALLAAAPAPSADVALYAEGSYGRLLRLRVADAGAQLLALPFLAPGLLGLFGLGLAAARLELARAPERHRALLRRVVTVALPVGLAGKALYAALLLSGLGLAGQVGVSQGLAGPALGLAYGAWWLPRLARRPPPALAALGRMALTNYLAQSVVMTLLFFGYGLGLYGRLGPAASVPLALGLYALQLALSSWWLRRWRYGPMEWLWRSLTYGRPQPMRRAREGAPGAAG